MIKVSVIVPVYNARDYIKTCMESLVNQTMDEVEVIFVDDHGADDSMEVVNLFIQDYAGPKTLKVLETSSNSGPGVARNLGIEKAEGEYVAFVDSDDWVEVTFCEQLYKAAVKHEADIACGDLYLDNVAEPESRVMTNPRVKNGEFTPKKHAAYMTTFVSYFTTYIYRTEFLRTGSLCFPQTRSAEDSCFLTCCIVAAKRIATVEKPLYHYMVRSSSLSIKKDPLRYQQKLSSFAELLDYARRHDLYDPYKAELDFLYIKKGFLVSAFTYVKNAAERDSRILTTIYEEMTSQVPEYASNKYFKRKMKIRLLTKLIRKYPKLAGWVISRYVRKSGMML